MATLSVYLLTAPCLCIESMANALHHHHVQFKFLFFCIERGACMTVLPIKVSQSLAN